MVTMGPEGRTITLESYKIERASTGHPVHVRAALMLNSPQMTPTQIRVEMEYDTNEFRQHQDEASFAQRLLELLKARLNW